MRQEAIAANELHDFLRAHDADFEPPLTSRTDLTAYALKITTHGEVITARLEGELVGIAAIYANDLETRRAFVSVMCVSRPVRRMGVGSRLLHEAIQYAKDRSMQSIELRTDQHRPDLIRYYERLGFQVIDSIPRFGGFVGVRMVQDFPARTVL